MEAKVLRVACKLCQTGEEHDHKKKTFFSCQECPWKAFGKDAFGSHMAKVHSGKMPNFSCSACTWKSFGRDAIKSHIAKAHKGEEAKWLNMSCTLCQKGEKHDHLKKKSNAHTTKFECTFCFFACSNSREEIIKHMRIEHPKERLFECDICNYKSNWFANLRVHKAAKHGGKKLSCDLCGWETMWRNAFLTHKRDTHGIYRKNSKSKKRGKAEYACDLCIFFTLKKDAFKVHTKKAHTKNYIDKKPKVRHYGLDNEIKPELKHSKSSIIRPKVEPSCEYCDYKCEKKIYLISHRRLYHSENGIPLENILTCTSCSFQSDKKQLLASHMKNAHKDEATFKFLDSCKECDYKSSNIVYMQTHEKLWHSNVALKEENIFQCEQCEYETSNNMSLKNHVRFKHNKEVKIACSMCNLKSFFRRTVIQHIERVHKNQEARWLLIGCPSCAEEKAHTQCEPKKTIIKPSKEEIKEENEYVSKDTEIKSEVVCDKCGFIATNSNGFKTHQRAKHGIVNENRTKIKTECGNECGQCDYKAARKCDLTKHLQAKHSNSVNVHTNQGHTD
jgi:KRAB domain-containing zinc finger protein